MVSRYGHHYPNKSWAQWRDGIVGYLTKLQNLDRFENPCRLTIQYWYGDRRRRDIPGMVDALYHCLERSGILKDDSLVTELHWHPMGYDKANPRVTLKIEELNGLD